MVQTIENFHAVQQKQDLKTSVDTWSCTHLNPRLVYRLQKVDPVAKFDKFFTKSIDSRGCTYPECHQSHSIFPLN